MKLPEEYPQHGGQLRQISERFGIAASQLLDFSANINPDGPPLSVLSTLRESLEDLSMLTEYPDLEETKLKQSIARYTGVSGAQINVANGFVPLLESTLRTLKTTSCLLPVPAFVEYRKTLERAGVGICTRPLDSASGFRYDPAEMLSGAHNAILIANPQNPSGVCHSAAAMRDLVERAADMGIFVLLDEAFIDYLPEHSLTTATNEFSNLIVFRSVTKFHGIPGLRVAYAVTNAALSSSIGRDLPPWPITTLASRAVGVALDDEPYAVHARAKNLERRIALQRDLELLGLSVYPSAANFLLVQVPRGIDTHALWQHLIVRYGIVLRFCGNYEALPPGHLRIAVRTQEQNSRLTAAMAELLLTLRLRPRTVV